MLRTIHFVFYQPYLFQKAFYLMKDFPFKASLKGTLFCQISTYNSSITIFLY